MDALSETKIEQLNRQPVIETSVQLSADQKWVIHKTTITDLKPISYMDKVLENKPKKKKE